MDANIGFFARLLDRSEQPLGQFLCLSLVGEDADDVLLVQSATNLQSEPLEVALKADVAEFGVRCRADDEPKGFGSP